MRFLRLAFVALVVLASDASALSATSKLQRLSARINAESQRQHALAETQIYTENQDKGGNGLLTTGWVKVDDLVDINQIRKKTTGGLLETEAQHKQTETETETEDDENSPHVLLETERLMSQLSSLETALAQAKQQQQQQQQQQQRGPVLMETHEDDDEEDSMIERLSTQLSHLESALAQHQQQQQRGPVLMEQEPNNDDIDVESMIGHIEDQLGSLERELEQHQGPPPGRAGDSTNDHRITDPFNDPLTHMESDLPEYELMEISQQQQHDEEMMQQLESRVAALTRRLNTQHLTSDDDDTELLEVSDARCPGYPPQYHYITKIGTTVINKCYDCSTYGYNWIWDGRTSCVHSGRFGW